MRDKPTDTEIVGLLVARRGSVMPTYYIKNCLRPAHPELKTPWVLRRLRALAKAGLVREIKGQYATMLCWEAVVQKEGTRDLEGDRKAHSAAIGTVGAGQ